MFLSEYFSGNGTSEPFDYDYDYDYDYEHEHEHEHEHDYEHERGAAILTDTISVNIMGVPYTLRAGDDPRYVTRVGEYVDKMMSELAASSPKLSQLQVAVLTSLNLADLLHRAQEANQVIDRANTRLRRILDQME